MTDTQAAELLADLARRITASLDLRETLQVVARAVVDQLGFGAAVVNLVQPGDMCEVAAAAGPDDVGQALLGTRAPMESFRRLLDGCEAWGELRFLDHRKDQGLSRGLAGWTPPVEPSVPNAALQVATPSPSTERMVTSCTVKPVPPVMCRMRPTSVASNG